jgi:hypothetical protein
MGNLPQLVLRTCERNSQRSTNTTICLRVCLQCSLNGFGSLLHARYHRAPSRIAGGEAQEVGSSSVAPDLHLEAIQMHCYSESRRTGAQRSRDLAKRPIVLNVILDFLC